MMNECFCELFIDDRICANCMEELMKEGDE